MNSAPSAGSIENTPFESSMPQSGHLIPVWLPWYLCELPQEVREKLRTISPSTIDRLMAPCSSRYGKLGLATTKPGFNQWNEHRLGFREAEAITHCGPPAAGQSVYTINCAEKDVVPAIQSIENHLLFPLEGFDCDNGTDNGQVEEKNRTHVRQYPGYQQTPLQRILESEFVYEKIKTRLERQLKLLNPLKLQKQMKRKITAVMNEVNQWKLSTKRRKKKEAKKREEKQPLLQPPSVTFYFEATFSNNFLLSNSSVF